MNGCIMADPSNSAVMDAMPDSPHRLVRSGVFEVDLDSGELRKAGRRVALQEQPFRILVRLLDRPGQVVTREELRRELWPDDTFVGFEQGLNAAVRRLREALGDSAESPRFIETMPRRGYRYIAPVDAPAVNGPEATTGVSGRARRVWLTVSAILLVLMGVSAFTLWRGRADRAPDRALPAPAIHSSIELPADAPLIGGVVQDLALPILALSRDGRQLAYVGPFEDSTRIYLRATDGLEVRPIAGTEGAIHPFFSPDGQWLGFLTDEKIRVVNVGGGTPATLGDTINPITGQWLDNGWIHVSDRNGTRHRRLREDGGASEVLMEGVLEPREDRTTGPQRTSRFYASNLHVLPGGEWALGVRGSGSFSHDFGDIVLLPLDRREEPGVLVRSAYFPLFAPPDRLLFVRGGDVFAQRFDPVQLEVQGDPVLVAAGVAVFSIGRLAQIAVSDTGLFLYASGSDRAVSRPAWVDGDGRIESLPMPAAMYSSLDLSPDGSRIAVGVRDVIDHVRVYGLRDSEGIRLSAARHTGWPVWSPDGRDLAVSSWQERLGAGWTVEIRRLGDPSFSAPTWSADHMIYPTSWSLDGTQLAFIGAPETRYGLAKIGEPIAWGPERSEAAAVSPDGRWLAFASRGNVFVQSHPDGNVVRQISMNGGAHPVWCRCGDGELFYMRFSSWYGQEWMRVSVRGDPPEVSRSRIAFHTDAVSAGGRPYAVSPDGRRLLVLRPIHKDAEPSKLHLRANWMP